MLDKMMLKTDKKSDLSSQKSFEAQQNLVRDKRNLFGKTYQLITLSWLEFKLSKVVNHTFLFESSLCPFALLNKQPCIFIIYNTNTVIQYLRIKSVS